MGGGWGVPCAGAGRKGRAGRGQWAGRAAVLLERLLLAAMVAAPASVQAVAATEVSTTPASPDAPLRPPELLQESLALYPEALKAEPIDGEAELELLVDETGAVSEVTLIRGVHPLFDAAALAAATGLRFRPATLEGKPVPVRMRFIYRFLAPSPPSAPAASPRVAEARRSLLSGVVRSRGNRNPISGASLASPEGSAVMTDPEGRFRLALPPGDKVSVAVRAPGFQAKTFQESLLPDESVEVVYALDPVRVNPYETIVRAERPRTEVTRVSLQSQELREVPGTMGDPFRVVMLMPGVASMLSGVAYPVVRGAAPSSTGYYLDGVRVPLLFHLFLGPAVVHPDFVDGLDFYPGAPPPQYGRLLGGVIDGRTRRPHDDRLHFTAYADLINTGAFVEVPIEATGTSVTVAGRYSYTPWLVALTANALTEGQADYVLDFWDYQGRVEQKLLGGRLRLFAFGSGDDVGTESDDPDVSTTMQSVLFHRIDLRYQRGLLGGELELGGTWGLDELSSHARSMGDARTDFEIHEDSWAARLKWTRALGQGFELQLGGDLDHRATQITVGIDGQISTQRQVAIAQPLGVGTFAGTWSSLVWRGHGWTVVPGARFDSFWLVPGVKHFSADPRLAVRKDLSDALTLKAAAGLYHQAPTTLIQMPVVDMAGLAFGLQEAAQIDVGLEWKIFQGLELSVDAYLNPLLRTVEINPFDPRAMSSASPTPFSSTRVPRADEIFSAEELESKGWAWGLEVMLRHRLGGNWFGWLSYSLQRSTRWVSYTRYDANGASLGEDSGYLPYAYDQTLILNAVLFYQLPRGWTAGAVFHFNTGRPESGVMTSSTLREGTLGGRPTWVAVSRDQANRLPAFFRVDVRLAKTWTFDSFVLDAYLDMLNASFQSETVAFTYAGGVYRGGGALTKGAIGVPVILPILGVKGAY
ncbi:MAG: TonB family protein [Deltaproteobacteria bacterium]|nr:TonB family protein [Deltaproteobacteria bacterium]